MLSSQKARGSSSGGRKQANRHLEAAGARNMKGMGSVLQAGAGLLGRQQQQQPTKNHSQFQQEQTLLKERFHLTLSDKAQHQGLRMIPRGLQLAQGYFDGATHQVRLRLPAEVMQADTDVPCIVGQACWKQGTILRLFQGSVRSAILHSAFACPVSAHICSCGLREASI